MSDNTQGNTENNGLRRSTSKRGFASMDREQQRRIASQGGKTAHQRGVAHKFDSAEAREAGRKGGESISQNREYMAEIGRRGGAASRGGRGKINKNADIPSQSFDEDLQSNRTEEPRNGSNEQELRA